MTQRTPQTKGMTMHTIHQISNFEFHRETNTPCFQHREESGWAVKTPSGEWVIGTWTPVESRASHLARGADFDAKRGNEEFVVRARLRDGSTKVDIFKTEDEARLFCRRFGFQTSAIERRTIGTAGDLQCGTIN